MYAVPALTGDMPDPYTPSAASVATVTGRIANRPYVSVSRRGVITENGEEYLLTLVLAGLTTLTQ